MLCKSTQNLQCSLRVSGLQRVRQHRSKLYLRTRPVCKSIDDDNIHEAKLGPNVLSGIKDLRYVKWLKATVLTNQAASADSSVRLLHLSIEDQVDLLYGRKVQGIPESLKWIDSYTVPGQCVAVRTPQSSSPGTEDEHAILKCLYNVASTPYQSRQDSAYLSSSLIEILVPRDGEGDAPILAELPAGAQLEVSQVIGRGFSSLFNSFVTLPTALEERRPLLMVASGAQGMAAIRSAANWPPFQAYASTQRVAFFYFTDSPVTAAVVPEWDRWREAGVDFRPVYTSTDPNRSGLEAVTHALFEQSPGFQGAVGGQVGECAVLLAGFPGDDASKIFRLLTDRGVAGERVLFCNFF